MGSGAKKRAPQLERRLERRQLASGEFGEPDVVRMADARRGDVELAAAEAWRRQVDAYALERLSLRLMDTQPTRSC